MSTIKAINVIHPSSTTNNIVTDDSGNVAVGGELTVGGVAAVAVAPGTSGNVLTSDGTDWTSATAPVINSQTFDASGTWTKPSGYAAGSRVHIQAWGAGGSGGRNTTATSCSGGGGGGYNERGITLSALSATETITIGAGGASRTGSNQAGAIGGNSSFGAHITAYGGGGGSGVIASGGTGGGMLSRGVTGTGSGSDFPGEPIFAGFDGRLHGLDGTLSFWHGGGGRSGSLNGAGSVFGGGGGGGNSGGASISSFGGNGGGNSTAGSQPGGGGGSSASTSGAGGDGRVIITVFPA